VNAVRRAGWVVGAVVGVAVGTGVGFLTQDWQEAREASDLAAQADFDAYQADVPPPVDAIQELLDQDTRVVVDPLLEDRIPAEDRARAEEILASSPVPAHIAYLTYPHVGEDGYTSSGAGPQWWTNVGEEGHYVIFWDTGFTEAGAVGLEPEHVWERTEGQPGPALVRIAEEMTTWEAVPADDGPYEVSDFDYWGGPWGGLGAAALFGAIGVLPVFFLVRWFVGSRRRKVH
jgi:hypothetical protein